MQNHPRNPILIIVFSTIRMTIRYGLFYCFSIIKGTTPKKIRSFSEGFKQIVYNLILTLVILFGLFFFIIFYQLNNH